MRSNTTTWRVSLGNTNSCSSLPFKSFINSRLSRMEVALLLMSNFERGAFFEVVDASGAKIDCAANAVSENTKAEERQISDTRIRRMGEFVMLTSGFVFTIPRTGSIERTRCRPKKPDSKLKVICRGRASANCGLFFARHELDREPICVLHGVDGGPNKCRYTVPASREFRLVQFPL